MHRSLLLAAAFLAAAACSREPQPAPANPQASSNMTPPAPPATQPSVSAATEDVRDSTPEPIIEKPFAPESAQGAANVVQTYYALIEAGDYPGAHALRWDSDTLSLAAFEANFAPYAEYHATVGAPSEIQGAAGSLYVEVPVQTYGRRKDGKPFGSAGTIALRRINDVPGSTATERRWRIYTGG
jgi:hypothetical protein